MEHKTSFLSRINHAPFVASPLAKRAEITAVILGGLVAVGFMTDYIELHNDGGHGWTLVYDPQHYTDPYATKPSTVQKPPVAPKPPVTQPSSIDVRWLWTTYSNAPKGSNHQPIPNPPTNDQPNNAVNIPIDKNRAHEYYIFWQPTISCQEFVNVLKASHSPAASVAAEMWYKAYLDGVNPAFLLGLFHNESSYGTGYNSHSALTAAQENLGNETYLAAVAHEHYPYIKDYQGPDGRHWMDFSNWDRLKPHEGWVISTAYTDGWLWDVSKNWGMDIYSLLWHWDPPANKNWGTPSPDLAPVEQIMAQYDGK